MFESFAINVVAAIFLDANKTILKNWSDPQVQAIKAVFKYALDSSTTLYSKQNDSEKQLQARQALKTLVRDADTRYLFLDLALSVQNAPDLSEFDRLCKKHGLDSAPLMDLLNIFLMEIRQEIRIVAEDVDSPLFHMASLYGQDRIENKADETLASIRRVEQILTALPASEARLIKLQTIMSQELERQLIDIQKQSNIGLVDDALEALQNVRLDNEKWNAIAPEVKFKFLRYEASLRLEMRVDVETAKILIQDAERLLPNQPEDKYIRALLSFIEKDFIATLNHLETLNNEQATHLKALAYIELERYDDAESVLKTFLTPSSIHFYFTSARLALIQHRIFQSIDAINLALKIAPDSEDMQYWLGQLKYFSVLSPAFRPTQFQKLPVPIPPIFYKASNKFKQQLDEAREIFGRLSEHGREDLRLLAQLWHLACLINIPEHQDDAITYCQRLINDNQHSDVAVAWGIDRNLAVDYEPAIHVIKQKINDGKQDSNFLITLTNYFLHRRLFQDALELMSNEQLPKDNTSLKHELLFQIALESGDVEVAKEQLNLVTNAQRNRQLRFMLHIANEDKSDIEAMLLEDFTDDLPLLLSICHYLSRQNLRGWISQYAEVLVVGIETEFAFSLVIEATFLESKTNQCLLILDLVSRLIYPDQLPWAYINVRAKALLETGEVKNSYLLAKKLYEIEPNNETFLTLASICEQVGDIETISVLGRDLIDKVSLPVLDTLKVTQIISLYNLELAKRLWRQVMKGDLPDEAVSMALILAHTLGTKAETESLFKQMQSMAENANSGFHFMPAKEAIKIIQDRNQFAFEVDQKYQQGQLPIHLVSTSIGVSFLWLYHDRLRYVEENSTGLPPQTALMIRHGNRPMFGGIERKYLQGHLGLDITSILLEEHFGILELLESEFSPIRVPQRLIASLVEMLLEYHQMDRERIDASKEIINLVDSGKLTVVSPSLPTTPDPSLVENLDEDWVRSFYYTKENNGCFVNFMPINKVGIEFEPADLSEDVNQYLIDIRAFVDALLEYRTITQQEYDRIIRSLGSSAAPHTSIRPPKGAKIVFFANTLELLGGHNLLWKLPKVFEIVLTSDQIKGARQVVNGESELHKTIDWLFRLIQRMFQGIVNGKYQVLPLIEENPVSEENKDAISSDLHFYSLWSLFEQWHSEGDVIVTDDRMSNRAFQNQNGRILTSVDILRALAENGTIDLEEYYQLLMRFRRSNLRSIPYGSDEILFHLSKNFDVDKLCVNSSLQLDTICEYLHSCLSQITLLQTVPNEGTTNQIGEKGIFELTYANIIDALYRIWEQHNKTATCSILSSWILDNLYAPYRQIFIDQGLLTSTSADKPFPELFEIANRLSPKYPSGDFSKQEKYRIWLWYWIKGQADDSSNGV